jgi:hypothetical protein
MVYSRAERVFILEHYFASKSFAAIRKAFSNAYPDKEVPNKTTIHRLVTIFWDTESVRDRKHLLYSRSANSSKEINNYEKTTRFPCYATLMSPKLTNTGEVTVAF